MRALLLLVLLGSGCRKNHELLETRLADAERQLARQQALAERLLDDRKALAASEQELASALAENPEARAAVIALEEEAPPPAVLPSFPALPPESIFEGARGEQLRRHIHDCELRIAQLAKITSEAEKLAARRRHVQRQLEQVRSQRR